MLLSVGVTSALFTVGSHLRRVSQSEFLGYQLEPPLASTHLSTNAASVS